MVVTDNGHVWQWSVAIPALSELPLQFTAGSPQLPAPTTAAQLLKPKLVGVYGTATIIVIKFWRLCITETVVRQSIICTDCSPENWTRFLD